MKNLLIALPLAATLVLPAAAQQNNTTDQQNSATTTQSQPATTDTSSSQATQATPTTGSDARQPLKPETRQGFWGKLNPMARKKYVQRQIAPVRDRVNELDELTATNSKMLKDVDSRATEGIRRATDKANLADQHAVDAGNRAQQANQTAEQANNRLQSVQQVVENIDQYQSANQVELRFRPGATTLSKNAKDALDQLAENLKDQKGYVIEVQGFAPGKGSASIQQSQHMADAVVRYLVLNHQIPVFRIYELGMGNAKVQTASANADDSGAKKTASARSRVEVTLLKNGIDQLGAQQAQAAPAQAAPAQGQSMAQPTSNQQPQ